MKRTFRKRKYQQKKEKIEKNVSKRESDVLKTRHVFRCPICLYHTNRSSNLKRHQHVMHNIFDVPVECCDILFSTKSELKKHTLSSHQEGYACKYFNCNKVFERRSLLKRHQCVHTGEKRFTCNDCDYKTSHRSNLSRHCEIKSHELKQLNGDAARESSQENSSSENSEAQSADENSSSDGFDGQCEQSEVTFDDMSKSKMKSVRSKKHLMETTTEKNEVVHSPSSTPTQNTATIFKYSSGWMHFISPELQLYPGNPFYPE
uniref:C2H2-type domain-containing protein n=1 Tax=Strigamia maritima TaxID=126957 RepID=T1IGQ5_STRMM